MKEVYCVVELLDYFYDDNDKTLFEIVDSKAKAQAIIDRHPNMNLRWEKWNVG